MKCYHCDREVPDDSRICPGCGKRLFVFCPCCGYRQSACYPVCSQCGTNRENVLRERGFTDDIETIYRWRDLTGSYSKKCDMSFLSGFPDVLVIPQGITEIEGPLGFMCKTREDEYRVVIPGSVTKIGNSAFKGCTGLTSIEIPDSVTEIKQSTFADCIGLTSIEIPDSVTEIELSAFKGCTGLTSVEIPDSVTKIGNSAFEGCRGLTSVEIPNSVTMIGESAFEGCLGLTSVEIPEGVTTIGEDAFCWTGLTSIEIPDSVTMIGESAFKGCTKLNAISVSGNNDRYKSEGNCCLSKDGKTLVFGCKDSVIPEGVTTIGNSAFEYCTELTSIEIPESVTKIGSRAFVGCTSLTSIEIPDRLRVEFEKSKEY